LDKRTEILNQIEELRQTLQELVNQDQNLNDPKIVAASQMLDALLNEYQNLIK
jgi:stage 0 sporulation regulatory protein